MKGNSNLNAEGLLAAGRNLGNAVVDPALWPHIMQQISDAASASGAVLLRSDVRTPDAPRTASAHEAFKNYFATGWHKRDTLAERGFPLFMSGRKVISDQDLLTPGELKRHEFYNEVLLPFDFQWFAGIGFRAGPALWAMLIMRAPRQGPFERDEKRMLARLASRLSEAATLSRAVGYAELSSTTSALDLVGQPTVALDRLGCVLDMSISAVPVFDGEFYISKRRLVARDPCAAAALNALVDQLRTTADSGGIISAPIVVRRAAKVPLVIRILPVDGAARSPFLGARALLTLSSIEPKRGPDAQLIADAFGLTPAEADVAAMVAQGKSLAAIAAARGIARVTVRNQIKTIFAKTGTHRQSELAALLASL